MSNDMTDRLKHFDLTGDELVALQRVGGLLEPYLDQVLAAFYDHAWPHQRRKRCFRHKQSSIMRAAHRKITGN